MQPTSVPAVTLANWRSILPAFSVVKMKPPQKFHGESAEYCVTNRLDRTPRDTRFASRASKRGENSTISAGWFRERYCQFLSLVCDTPSAMEKESNEAAKD